MKQKDIKTFITSGTMIIAVALYLIFAPEPDDNVTSSLEEAATSEQQSTADEQVNGEQVANDEQAAADEASNEDEQANGADDEQATSSYTLTPQAVAAATGNELVDITFVSSNDGDTFKVKVDGREERIRLLMIDTPEMNYNKGEPMPYAEQAKDFTYNLLKNAQSVQMVYDVGPATDNYDRLLTYVFADGVLVQEALLREGLAAVRYVNKPNNTLEDEFRAIQQQTADTKLNIWAHDDYFQKDGFHAENVK